MVASLISFTDFDRFGYPQIFWTGWGRAFGTFMISRPTLGCTHWWECVYSSIAVVTPLCQYVFL